MKQSVISYVPMAERYDVLVLGGGTAGVMAGFILMMILDVALG